MHPDKLLQYRMFTAFLYLTCKRILISATYGSVYAHVIWNPFLLISYKLKFENNYKKVYIEGKQ